MRVLLSFCLLSVIASAFVSSSQRRPSTTAHFFFGDALKKAFANEEFSSPTEGIKATARHILVPTLDEAQMVLDQIGGDVGFSALAEQFSTCPSGKSGGMLGSFKPGTMVSEFDAVIFDPETELGTVVGPVETNFGYHLIVVDSRTGI